MARLDAIITNIELALVECGWPPEWVETVVHQGLQPDRRWIKGFHSYGIEPLSTKWMLHFWIEIDWDEHGRLLLTQGVVDIDDRWINGVNPGIDIVATKFANIVRDNKLTVKTQMSLAEELSADPKRLAAARAILQSRAGEPPEPLGVVETTGRKVLSGISEVSIGLDFSGQ